MPTRRSSDATRNLLAFGHATTAFSLRRSHQPPMRRLSVRDLAKWTPADLSAELFSRITHQRELLERARAANSGAGPTVPPALAPAFAKVERGWNKAAAASSDADALQEMEDGAAATVDEVRKLPTRGHPSDQDLLRTTFEAVVGHRALVQAAAMARAEAPLLLPAKELGDLISDSIDDARAFCREKHGDSPEARVMRVTPSRTSSADSTAADDGVLLAPFVAFSLHELLKNAMGAHVRYAGADKLDRLPPIAVRYGMIGGGGEAFVSVSDCGGGLHGGHTPEEALTFLHTTNPEREPTYTYSRNFGSPFEGLGVGLPLAALHAQYLGGAFHLHNIGGNAPGVHGAFTFDTSGNASEPELSFLDVGWLQKNAS